MIEVLVMRRQNLSMMWSGIQLDDDYGEVIKCFSVFGI